MLTDQEQLRALRGDLADRVTPDGIGYDGQCDEALLDRCRALHTEDLDTLVIPDEAPYIEAGDGSGVWVVGLLWVPTPETSRDDDPHG